MSLKAILWAIIDCQPIKKVTAYAAGTALSGIGATMFLAVRRPDLFELIPSWVPLVVLAVGVCLATSSYELLKRRYKIVRLEDANAAAPKETGT